MGKLTKKQIKERDVLIFGEKTPNWSKCKGDVIRFQNLALSELETLVKKGYIELDENQNDSPSTEEFLEFMRQYPATLGHGYVVAPDRDDERVTLEGIAVQRADVTPELFRAFVQLCRCADEFTDNDGGLYAWWD
jgi:hypothetical protein